MTRKLTLHTKDKTSDIVIDKDISEDIVDFINHFIKALEDNPDHCINRIAILSSYIDDEDGTEDYVATTFNFPAEKLVYSLEVIKLNILTNNFASE